jgi:hypothetical protein
MTKATLTIKDVAHIYISEWDFEYSNPCAEEPSDNIATSYYVTVANDYGNTWHHKWILKSNEVGHHEARDRVEKMLDRIQSHLEAGGSIDLDHWGEGTPMYGSEAWQRYEREEIAPYAEMASRGVDIETFPDAIRGYF